METITAKSLLQRVKPDDRFWFHQDYNMNLYQGCSFGCIYCDSRSDCYHNLDFSKIKPKENALAILEKELRSKKSKGVIGLGSMSDPYNFLENSLQLTRRALQLIDEYGFSVSIVTKSALVCRDIDILSKIALTRPVQVALTITETNPEIQKRIEPHSSTSQERFEAIDLLRRAGIFAGILMMPVLPFMSDREENIRTMVEMAVKCDAQYIHPFFGLTMRSGQREYFYDHLKSIDPTLPNRYARTYGNQYICPSPNSESLNTLFQDLLKNTSLKHTMLEINDAFYHSRRPEQVKFDI